MGRRILAIAAAAVIALIGAVLVLALRTRRRRASGGGREPDDGVRLDAVVPAGTSLKEAMRLEQITQTQVAARSLPAGALTTVDDTNSALVALTDIPPGQYVLAAAFGETPVGEKALQVGAGKLAVYVRSPTRPGSAPS